MRTTQPTRRGNAILDTALVLPILLALGFGTVEFGHFFYVKNVLQGAARDGVRAAIVPAAVQADVTNAVTATMTAAGLQSRPYTLTTTPANVAGQTAGTTITVSVTCRWSDVGLRPLSLISADKQVIGAAVMRKE